MNIYTKTYKHYSFDDIINIYVGIETAKRKGKVKRLKHLLYLKKAFGKGGVYFGYGEQFDGNHISRLKELIRNGNENIYN